MDSKTLSRIEKLKALAERGVGGEKVNAQRMLTNLLKKHGMSLDDLASEETVMHWIKWRGGIIYRRLLSQIMTEVCGRDRGIYTSPGYRSCLGAKVSPSELAEITIKYDAYSIGLKEQIDATFIAFINRHDIFPAEDYETEQEAPQRSLKEMMAMSMMMDAMPDIQVNPRLEAQ